MKLKLSEYIKELQKQYREKEARKVTVKLLCNLKAVRSVNNGTN